MKNKFEKIIYTIKKNKFLNNIYEKWQDIHTIVLFFIICFGILIWKIFSYTVIDYEFYRDIADKQQIGTFVVPINRGTIYSSLETNSGIIQSSFLATSINLYDLAIDPKQEGNKEKLGEYLTNIVYTEICQGKTSSKCKSNLLRFLSILDLEDFENTPEYVKKHISEKINTRISQTKLTNSIIGTDFSKEQVQKIENLKIRGVYTRENSITVNPEEYNRIEENEKKIAEILNMSTDQIKKLTARKDLRYIPIYRKLSINSYEEIKKLEQEEKDAIKKQILEKKESISGFFILSENPTRSYPEGDIASQIIGFIDNDGIGRYGLEGYFNDILKGNNGKIVARKDVKNRIIDTIVLEKDDLIGEGVKIVTTIDRNVQKKVEEILEAGVKRYAANKGTIVVTEPKTGRVLAMANYPTYDINNKGDVMELEKVTKNKYPNPSIDLLGYPVFVEDTIEGKKFQYDNKEIFLRDATPEEIADPVLVKYKYKNGFGAGVYKNDAISGLYEPGSIMKSISVAIGIDTGEITKDDKYDDKGSLRIDQFEIKNESSKCLGYQTFQNALDFSCNVGMVRIFQRVGKSLVSEYFENFGFGEKTGIDLEGENFAPLGAWEKWAMANLFTKSYGLGVAVTPLHMASAYNTLVNGGIYVKPKIIEKIIYPNGQVIEFKTEEKRRVIKESTSKTMIKMLERGVTDGLADAGKVEGYSVGGKTGTSQILYKGKYQSGPGWTNASYAGFGPVEDPKFVIIVKLERPRSNVYGSMTSGHLFREVATYLFDYYGIPKSKK